VQKTVFTRQTPTGSGSPHGGGWLIRKTAWLLGMTVLAIVVYYRGLSGAYYGDDLGFAFDDPLSKIG